MADDFSTYAGRQAYRDAHPGAIVDASGAYSPTTGQTSSAVVPQTAGGAAGTGPFSATSAQSASFGAPGVLNTQDLAERKRQFDANLAWTKQMWEQQGLPQLVIQQKAAQLQQDEFNFQSQMAQRQQALAEVTGIGGLGLQQQQTALDALKTAASLGGPSSWVQASNYARGVNATDVPVFMRNLVTGVGAPAATGGVGLSAPQTFGGIASQLSGGATPAGTSTGDLAQTLDMGRKLFTTGGAGLAPGSLENLSDTESKMLGSVGQAVGADLPTFLRAYSASRIGQGAAQAA